MVGRIGHGLGLLALTLAVSLTAPAAASSVKKDPSVTTAPAGGAHRASPYYRKGPQVRGFVQRRGGYSYSAGDVINTYGNNRSLYGGANVYRDRMLDRQTPFGPFDHGFFFDSGIGPRGGNSPYPN
jgi:hypothetical protein